MTPRIILPADTTVTVGDTLWWGVEEWMPSTDAEHIDAFARFLKDVGPPATHGGHPSQRLSRSQKAYALGMPTVPPEWQALTEVCDCVCHDPEHDHSFYPLADPCDVCQEGRRTVEVERPSWPGEWDDIAPGTDTPVPLGRAVIDGDWAPIVDWKDQRAIATLDRFVATGWEGDPSWFGLYTRGALPGQRMERFTLHVHGHTGPGGYAARFEVIA